MTVAIDQEDWKKVLAEVVGTFFFFFIGIGSIAGASQAGATGLLIVALAHGLALSIAITALGPISGAHFNPAVTISLLVARKISPLLALLYILGQLIGGVAACLVLGMVLPRSVWEPFSLGTPGVATIGIGQAVLLEAVLTFFLVVAVFGTAVDARAPKIGGFGVGLTVFVDILVGGPFTGGVMNPARAISPAIVSGAWNDAWWIYWVGPILGGILAALLYKTIFLPREGDTVVTAPTVTDQPLEPPFSEPNLLDNR
ncbi:MAG: aquaporin [Chloroflexota bacterium]|nr:aquaporin [Chloroflexota bacterium]MDQ5864956.1 aquaporin [Chloroflexota bacterium]